MGDKIYDERRRLERENDLLREQRENERLKREIRTDKVVDLTLSALEAFFTGRAAFVIAEGHETGAKTVSFRMPIQPIA